MTMHRRDYRLRKIGEALDCVGLEVGFRRTLTLCDVGELVARGKTFSGAAHNDQADALGFVRDSIDMIAQLDKHVDVERIKFFGAIERESRQTFLIFAQH
jgi:hypothetical protein